jgi:hypothetical protein
VDIAANVKYVRWRDRPDRVQPSTVANTVYPVGWHQGHRWSTMEIAVLSEAKDAFYDQAVPYIVDNADNVVIPYLVISLTAHDASTKTVTTSNAIVDYVDYGVSDYEESVNVYHLKCFYIGPPT